MTSPYHHFDGMCFPLPGGRLEEVEYALRFPENGESLSTPDRLLAASALAAYQSLVWRSAASRNAIVKELRKAANELD
jgi:hypothetical protein